MAKIVLEGHSYYNANIKNNGIYSLIDKDNHHARILIDVKSEIFNIQIQFISFESMPDCWTKEELLIAFNKAYMHIKGYIDSDVPLNIFTANIFHLESVKLQANELIDWFKIEISEDKKNVEKINTELLKLKEANNNFNNCKDKLIKVMQWNIDLINYHSYNINRVIDYLFHVIDAGVVTDNKEDFIQIRSSFDKLRNQKNRKNNNYQTNLNTIISNINVLKFPNYFKNELPNIEINTVLDEIY